jgi:hypothetical protein
MVVQRPQPARADVTAATFTGDWDIVWSAQMDSYRTWQPVPGSEEVKSGSEEQHTLWSGHAVAHFVSTGSFNGINPGVTTTLAVTDSHDQATLDYHQTVSRPESWCPSSPPQESRTYHATTTDPDRYRSATTTTPMVYISPNQWSDTYWTMLWPIRTSSDQYGIAGDPRRFTRQATGNDDWTDCDGVSHSSPLDSTDEVIGTWIGSGDMGQPVATDSSLSTFRYDNHQTIDAAQASNETYTITYDTHLTMTKRIVAKAGGPYPVQRAGSVTLDGSGSVGQNLTYSWSFAPGGDCPAGTQLGSGSMSGAKVTVVALCGLTATLTVRDTSGNSDTATASVVVSDRPFAATSVSHAQQSWTAKQLDRRTPTDFIYAGGPGTTGLNVNACTTATESSYLCPYLKWPYGATNTRLNKGYTLATVNNPGGPFHGFSYVNAATLSVQRRALFNTTLLPTGPKPKGAKTNFYNQNKGAGLDVDGFLAAIGQHEGEGAMGQPGSGHTGAIRQFLAADPSHDPDLALEAVFGPTQTAARDRADAVLTRIECDMANATGDPLPVIWGPRALVLWDPAAKGWVAGQYTVPGPYRSSPCTMP